MTFLNPLYLIALAAAAIPIILHLLNLRRTRVIEFSTLSFLKELQKSRIRRLKIRQWILLALRTLIIVCIVLAFARPAFRGSVGEFLGARARTSVVILLDDSFSMLASDEGGQLLKQAKAMALRILELLEPGDEVAFIRLSEADRGVAGFTAAHGAVRAEIENSQPSFAHQKMRDALTAAYLLLEESGNFNRELYVITDDQRSHFVDPEGDGNAPRLFDERVRIFISPLGSGRPQNAALLDVRVQNALFEKGKPVTVSTTVSNFGDRPLRNEVASVYLGGERVMQRSIDLDPGSRRELEFTVTPRTTGFIEGFIEMEDDILPEDNRRYFSFHVPDRITVLLAAERSEDAVFLRAALEAFPQGLSDPVFALRLADGARWANLDPKGNDVLVFLVGSTIGEGLVRRIESFVKEGGGLLVCPARDGTPAAFNALLRALGMPPRTESRGREGDRNVYTEFGRIDYDHPLFTGIFLTKGERKSDPKVESPKIYRALRLPRTEQSRVVIGNSAGEPFLQVIEAGNGKVVLLSTAPLLSWSDFPLKGLFVPLINRSIFFLASRDRFIRERTVGEAFDLLVPGLLDAAAAFSLSSPTGIETKLVPKRLTSGFHFPVDGLPDPGNYILKQNAVPVSLVPVNVNPAESDLTKLRPEEREEFWKSVGTVQPRLLERGTDIRDDVMQSRFGLELWKYMLGAAIFFALLEMMIARERKRPPVRQA